MNDEISFDSLNEAGSATGGGDDTVAMTGELQPFGDNPVEPLQAVKITGHFTVGDSYPSGMIPSSR